MKEEAMISGRKALKLKPRKSIAEEEVERGRMRSSRLEKKKKEGVDLTLSKY